MIRGQTIRNSITRRKCVVLQVLSVVCSEKIAHLTGYQLMVMDETTEEISIINEWEYTLVSG